MKMARAQSIIDGKTGGFMVRFEWFLNCMFVEDHFPDKSAGEPLIETEDEAWELARRFAEKTKGECINIHVVDNEFYPVRECGNKKIVNKM
jgi:hypothetical protein